MRREYPDAVVLPSSTDLPLPSGAGVGAVGEPGNPLAKLVRLGKGLVHNATPAKDEHHERPQLNVPTLDARWFLLSQVDAVWWGHLEPYRTDLDVLGTADLVDLAGPLRAGRLGFRYRMQPTNLTGRLGRAAQRRIWPGRRPHTAGLRFSRARPQLVTLLNQVADQFSTLAPVGTPPLWVTSLARSVEHQDRLRALGYYTGQRSAHCVGYAADVAMSWYRRFGSFCIAFMITDSACSVISRCGANSRGDGGGWWMCIARTSLDCGASNGGRPHSMSNRITPSE